MRVKHVVETHDLVPDVGLYNTYLESFRRTGQVRAFRETQREMEQRGVQGNRETQGLLESIDRHESDVNERFDVLMEAVEELAQKRQ